ncbi:MAG: protease modulator HflK [Planctomycetia bacterium]|nr:protease modulator HflK [Planctomycetia bacterium]
MRRFVLILFVLLIGGWLLTAATQIRPGERAVVRRFGRVVEVPRPGLYVGLPWPMDRVDRVPADFLRQIAVGYQKRPDEDADQTPPGQLLTGDHNLVNVQVDIAYTVDQGGASDSSIVDFVLHMDRTDLLVSRAVEAVLAEWTASRSVDEVLLTGKSVLPGWLVSRAQERIAPYQLGLRIQSASVSHLFPPNSVKAAFDSVTSAQLGIRTAEQEARQSAEQTVRAAEIERSKLEQATEARVNNILTMARIDAETFEKRRQEYQRLRRENPDILGVIWFDEMGRVFAGLQKSGRIDLLDRYLGGDGLDITQFAPQPRRR